MSVYQKDQLVWAKVKGYAWWPALVQKTNLLRNNEVDKEIHVAFIGEETHAVVSHDKIANFEEKFSEYSKVKTKKLQEALKIVEGMDTIIKDRSKSPMRTESVKKSVTKEKRAPSATAVKSKREESLPPAPAVTQTASRPRGRPRKNPEPTPAPKASASTRKERSRSDKSQTPVRAQTVEIMEIQTEKYPQEKASTKRQEAISQRTTRSSIKQPPAQALPDPPKRSVSKGRKESVSKESKKTPEPQVLQKMVLENLDNQFKQPAAKPRSMQVERLPERNLLSSINAEPNKKSYIEVTTRKETPVMMRNVMNSAVPKVGEKRSSGFWLKEQNAPTYLSNVKPTQMRNSATEVISKKVRVSPAFQQKMSSVKATKLKDLTKPRNSEVKALVAYNSLMIRKFENDMEDLLEKLVTKFKNKQKLQENDPDQIKLFNIINEFQKNKFDGSEFISSEVGKLFKTLHRLLISHRFLLSSTGNLLIVALAKVLQQVKEKIVRFCLDNTEYSGAFDIRDDMEQQPTGIENVDLNEIKAKIEESRNENRANVNREQPIFVDENRRSIAKKGDNSSTKKEEDTPKFMGASSNPGSQQAERTRKMNWPSNRRIPESPAMKVEEERNSRHGNEDFLGDSDTENEEGSLMMLRKKIAIKLTKALQDGYLADKSRAQEAAIALEAMVYKSYPEMVQEYKKAIKALYQMVKSQKFTIEDLAEFRTFDVETFKEILKPHRTTGRQNNFEQSNHRMEYERSSSLDRTRRGEMFGGLEESANIRPNFNYQSENFSPKDVADKNKEKLMSLNRSSKRVQNY